MEELDSNDMECAYPYGMFYGIYCYSICGKYKFFSSDLEMIDSFLDTMGDTSSFPNERFALLYLLLHSPRPIVRHCVHYKYCPHVYSDTCMCISKG